MTGRRLPESLVRELIQKHARSTEHRGDMLATSAVAEVTNPICGDVVRIQVEMEGNRVGSVRIGGHGCTLSQASASMAASILPTRTWAEIRQLEADFNAMIKGGEARSSLGDARALASVGRFPNRVRCARLVWDALNTLDPEGEDAD